MRHATCALAALAAAVLLAVYLHPAPSAATAGATPVPAPTTVAGYRALWASLDPEIWGAADVSLSVPMDEQRSVWLYGDTFSRRYGMVHSSAITQDGGRLWVSDYGLQLLPDAANGDVFWIEGAHKVDGTHIAVAAQRVRLGSENGLDFRRVGVRDHRALLEVSARGDVRFVRWTGAVAPPRLDERFLTPDEGAPYQQEGHLFYGKRLHPEARLADGKILVTICQNRMEPALLPDGRLDFTAYSPLFDEA